MIIIHRERYHCPYILRTGKVCNRGCYRPGGCKLHWNSPTWIPCKECGKLTYSTYGICSNHVSKSRKKVYYHQNKQTELHAKIVMLKNHIPDLPDSIHEV